MATRVKKLSVAEDSKILTESPKRKSKAKEKVLSTEKDPFPMTGKPGYDVDNAKVSMSEKEFQRLTGIESNIRELLLKAKDVKGTVAFGRLDPKYKEPIEVTRLRALLGVEPYVPPKKSE